MAKFKGFNNQQTYQLLTELGYDGPARKEQMDAFIAATPSAGSMLGRYTEIAKQRVEGKPLSGIGMSKGGTFENLRAASIGSKIGDTVTVGGKDYTKVAGEPGSGVVAKMVEKNTATGTTGDSTQAVGKEVTGTGTTGTTGATGTTATSGVVENYFDPATGTYNYLGKQYTNPAEYSSAVTDYKNSLVEKVNTGGGVPNLAIEHYKKTGETLSGYTNVVDAYKATENTSTISNTGLDKDVTGGSTVVTAAENLKANDTHTSLKEAAGDTEIGSTAVVGGETYTKVAGEPGSGIISKMVKTDTTGTDTTGTDTTGENYYDQNTGVYHYQGKEYTNSADYSEAVQNYRVSIGLPVDNTSAAVLDGRDIADGTVIDDEEEEVVVDDEEEEVVVDEEKEEEEKEEEEEEKEEEEEEKEEEEEEKDDTVIDDDLTLILDAAQKAYADAQKVLTDAQKAFNDLTDPSGLYTNAEEAYTGAFATDFNEGTDGKNKNLGEDKTWTRSTLQEYTNITKDSKVELTKPGKYYEISYPDLGISISTGHSDQKFAQGRLNILNAAVTANSNIVSAEEKEQLTLEYNTAKTNLDNAQSLIESTYADLLAAEERVKVTAVPSATESLARTISLPKSLVTDQDVYKITEQDGQLIDSETGQVLDADDVIVKLATKAGSIDTPKNPRGETYEAVMSQDNVKTALEDFAAATGTPSDEALMKAETMSPQDLAQLGLSPETLDTIRQIPEVKRNLDTGELPTAEIFDSYVKSTTEQIKQQGDIEYAKFAGDTPKATAEVDYTLNPTQSAEASITKMADAAKFSEDATAEEKKSEFKSDVTAEETNVSATELVDVNEILNVEEIVVTGATLTALNEDSIGKAQTATFSQQLEAKFVLGEVSPQSTVEGQLEKLMASFDDGTPAWAAGALRRVNEVMNARGLGGSSMVGAAMIQAAMESAIPIAQADAATFAAMDMENVRNKQAVALTNAAAAQKFELQNLNNRQAMAVQNSMNNANLQLTNLSNTQEAVLAQAQLRAGLQNVTLGISENVALANASRYAEVNNLNLTNRQQMSILESTQNLEVEMANLSNSQQTALSNLQVKASMMGQVLSNEQQIAVIESTQAFETEMQNATSKQQAFIQDAVATAAMEGRVLDNRQQTSLFNVSNQLAEREIELNNEQQTRMFNMTNKLNIEVENLSARQQTALANAQIGAAMKGQELTNKQQVNIIRSERIAEIANLNFTAEQTSAIRNSELAQTVDLANLNNRQAKLLADCAALTQVDMTNLNNRQQAAAQQAQAFLQMDMSNLDNEQQATMFEAQSLVQSIFSDQAAENASLQFNAESANQADQFFESLTTQVDQFNLAQENAMEQFNAGEENSMTKFQAELDNQRDIFNAQNQLVIAQANAVWRQSIATINNAADNEAAMREAMAANNLTANGIAELWQQERDLMEYVWKTADNAMERETRLALQNIASDGEKSSGLAGAAGTFLGSIVNGMVSRGVGIFAS
tara:strand:+ start:913 stop:5379 length:4467 start_codon:yes stop_codon:yes gene_type:complete